MPWEIVFFTVTNYILGAELRLSEKTALLWKKKQEHLILSGLDNSIFTHMLCFICNIPWYSSKKCNFMKIHLRRLATPFLPWFPYGIFWAAWDMLVQTKQKSKPLCGLHQDFSPLLVEIADR